MGRYILKRSAGRQWAAALGCLMAFATTQCGRGTDRAQADTSTITVLHPGDQGVFGPDWPAKFLVFLPLVARNAQGEIEGRLARSWEHSPDYREWTIHLHTDIRWHDGVPVTAHDVKFTLDLLSHPEVLYEPPGAYEVTVLDDSTYTLTYRKRAGGSPLDTWTAYYPKHLLEKRDPKEFWNWEFWTRPVGNGPYRYVRHLPGTVVELEANPEYHGPRPRIERVLLKLGAEYGEKSTLTDLLSGAVDVVPYLNQMDLLKVADDQRFRTYYIVDADNPTALVWNQTLPLFQDRRVRLALALATDRREVHRALNLPPTLPIFDAPITERQFQRGELLEPLPYDLVWARQLLDAAGWRDSDGNGVRDRNGDPFAFTMIVSDWQQAPRAAVLVQSQLRRVGVQAEIQTLDLQLQRQRVLAGQFHAALVMVVGPLEPRVLFGEGSPLGLTDPAVGTLLERARSTMNPGELDGIYQELAGLFQADPPAVFLSPAVWSTIAHRRVRGLSSPWRADPVAHMEEVWLEDGSQP